MSDGNIVLPRFLLQFLVEPLFAAMETVAGRETAGDSASLDMYQDVLECIQKAFPEEDFGKWHQRWLEIQDFGKEGLQDA